MKFSVILLQCACACAILTSVFTEEIEKKTRRRKCRCKKYIQQLNKEISERLTAFENKFENHLNYSFDNINTPQDSHNNNNNNRHQNDEPESAPLTISAERFDKLIDRVSETKESLRKESYSLRLLQENLYEAKADRNQQDPVTTLKTLEAVVGNISFTVEKLDKTVRSSLSGLKHERKTRHRHTTMEQPNYPKDCEEVYRSGSMQYEGDYYIVLRPEKTAEPFKSLCKKVERGGWTVIQRRQSGRVNFSRDWDDYKHGFGDLWDEFWLGNEKLHLLTAKENFVLKIDMEEWNGKKYVAEYEQFRVSDENDKYRLHVSGYSGNSGDCLTSYWRTHDGMPFSTRDNDNDNRFYDNCAEHYDGGWWFNDCFESHLNGKFYQNGSHQNYFVRNGIQWNSIHSYSSLRFVEMMIKPSEKVNVQNEV